jgi:hypothetical protein
MIGINAKARLIPLGSSPPPASSFKLLLHLTDMRQSLFVTVLCVAAGLGAARAADHTFSGEIMDSQCVQMGSHDNMMKSEGAKNAKECAIACVKSGGKYAFYDPAAKRTYQLDNQKKAGDYAGQKVTVI